MSLPSSRPPRDSAEAMKQNPVAPHITQHLPGSASNTTPHLASQQSAPKGTYSPVRIPLRYHTPSGPPAQAATPDVQSLHAPVSASPTHPSRPAYEPSPLERFLMPQTKGTFHCTVLALPKAWHDPFTPGPVGELLAAFPISATLARGSSNPSLGTAQRLTHGQHSTEGCLGGGLSLTGVLTMMERWARITGQHIPVSC